MASFITQDIFDLLIGLFGIWGSDIVGEEDKEKINQTISLLQSAGYVQPQIDIESLTVEVVNRLASAQPTPGADFYQKDEE